MTKRSRRWRRSSVDPASTPPPRPARVEGPSRRWRGVVSRWRELWRAATVGATDTNRACDRTRGWYARSIMSLTRLGGTRVYVELPSSLDSMWLILDAMVTKAHSNCASRSASSASLAAWAADGFRLDGGAFRRGFLLGLGISTGGGWTFFFLRKGSFLLGGGGGFEILRGSPINRACAGQHGLDIEKEPGRRDRT